MGTQIINLEDTDNIIFDNNETNVLRLNNTTIWRKPYILTRSSQCVVKRIGSSITGTDVSVGELLSGDRIYYGDVLEISPSSTASLTNSIGSVELEINGVIQSSNTKVTITVDGNVSANCYYWNAIFFAQSSDEDYVINKSGTSYSTYSFNDLYLERTGVNLSSKFPNSYKKFKIKTGVWNATSPTVLDFNKPTLSSSEEKSVQGTTSSNLQYVTVTGLNYNGLITPNINIRVRGSSVFVSDGIIISGIYVYAY